MMMMMMLECVVELWEGEDEGRRNFNLQRWEIDEMDF